MAEFSSIDNHESSAGEESEDTSVQPLPGGEVEVYSEQPWDSVEFPPEFMTSVLEAIKLHGKMRVMKELPTNFQDELGLLGRRLTDDEMDRLLAAK